MLPLFHGTGIFLCCIWFPS